MGRYECPHQELHLGSLEEQYVLLNTEPTLWSVFRKYFKICTSVIGYFHFRCKKWLYLLDCFLINLKCMLWNINGIFFSSLLLSLCKPWLKGTENKLVTRTQMLVSAPPCLTQWQYPHILNPLLMPGQDTQCRHRRLWEGEEAVKVQPSTTDILTFRETTHNQSTCNFPQTPVPKSWPKPHSGEGATATDEFCSWLCDA